MTKSKKKVDKKLKADLDELCRRRVILGYSGQTNGRVESLVIPPIGFRGAFK